MNLLKSTDLLRKRISEITLKRDKITYKRYYSTTEHQ